MSAGIDSTRQSMTPARRLTGDCYRAIAMAEESNRRVVSFVTSRPRAGRRFAPIHELDVVPDALNAAYGLPAAHRGLLVVSEMTGPTGIPDLTALVGDESKLESRLSSSVPALLNEVDAGVTAAASPKMGRTVAQLAAVVGWPEATVRRRIPFLLRHGALFEAGGRYIRDAALQPLGRIYAIEAKVSDWRQALRQARTYSLWADNYVLVLGRATPSACALALEQVALDRAGLVVRGEWVRRPNPANRAASRRLWAAEHVVAALRG